MHMLRSVLSAYPRRALSHTRPQPRLSTNFAPFACWTSATYSTASLRSPQSFSQPHRASASQLPLHTFRRYDTRALTMASKNYDDVLKGKYPAKEHARRVVEVIRSSQPDFNGVLYLEGQKTKMIEDNDSEEHFRQRRYFYYLTGCELPDCYLTYDIATSRSTLYIPPVDPESVIWSGLPMSASEALQKYDVDEVRYTHEVNAALTSLAEAAPSSTVYAIPNQVSDSITFLGFGAKNFDVLKSAIERARVVKSDYEIALIAKANDISGAAHLAVLKRVRHVSNERELYATFLAECISRGAPHMAYHSIVAAGRAAATLHYVKNDEPTAGKLNLLLDAACELNCYASDITRTFPISGSFTPESRAIYDTVLRMQLETLAMLKEGVRWDDVHIHAHRVAIEGLLAAGIFKKEFSVDEILESRTSVAFFPHGLGHYLGMDTHDTGGNANYQDKDTMFRYLRVRGTLPAGSVITVEPGIYFCNFIIEPYLKDEKHSKYIDAAVLDKYWDVGGVRIEDNVVITKDGYDNLTTAVKDAKEMEKIISSS
ncbi:hypothetical protein PoMZ_03177 [Pyricularia oryzae]|nr:hypothetical protein PoMZ_03177 [Pyricularia oryzae]